VYRSCDFLMQYYRPFTLALPAESGLARGCGVTGTSPGTTSEQ
jgi:hypothetical protein